MSSSVPSPVAAALGIVPTVVSGVRSLPGKAVQLPLLCVSSALTNLDRTRRGYDELAERGERLIARLRGTSFDELEDRVEDALQGTALAAPYDRVEDALEDVSENVTAFVRSAPARARQAAATVTRTATEAVDETLDRAKDVAESVVDTATEAVDDVTQAAAEVRTGVEDQAPKGIATPSATQPDSTPVHTAATPEVVATVERVTAEVGGDVVDRDELPLADFDHLTLGAVRGRMRSLDLPQLVQLRDYEKSKGNRLPIVTMLDNRIAKLATDPTATPSAGKAPGATATGGKATGASKAAGAAKKAPAKRARKTAGKVSPVTANDGASAPAAAFGGLGASVPGKG